jgi:hypothetical protein
MGKTITPGLPPSTIPKDSPTLFLKFRANLPVGRAWLRVIVDDLSLRGPRFAPGSLRVEFVVDKAALG